MVGSGTCQDVKSVVVVWCRFLVIIMSYCNRAFDLVLSHQRQGIAIAVAHDPTACRPSPARLLTCLCQSGCMTGHTSAVSAASLLHTNHMHQVHATSCDQARINQAMLHVQLLDSE